MDSIIFIDTVTQYNTLANNKTQHPLVSVVDLSKAGPASNGKVRFGFYTVFLKDVKCGNLRYGCNYYDYEKGTLVFIAPGQVIGIENDADFHQPEGYALLFHPDFIRGTSLGRHISDYTFFSYDVHEALHLSEDEREIISDCFSKIRFELGRTIDKHTKTLIARNIELLLDYCIRFYDRQFITRDTAHKSLLQKFENLLHDYFLSVKPKTVGLPTVAYCADQLYLSANYFGDLVKKETGKSPNEYIQQKVINLAKDKIFDFNKSISEIGYELGFKYPQHFNRSFKQHTGMTPNEYRMLS